MMDQIWTFIQTVVKGVKQGTMQYIENDLESYMPYFIVSAVILVYALLKRLIQKIKTDKK